MKKFKKALALTIGVTMAMGMVACGKVEDTDSDSSKSKEITISDVIDDMSDEKVESGKVNVSADIVLTETDQSEMKFKLDLDGKYSGEVVYMEMSLDAGYGDDKMDTSAEIYVTGTGEDAVAYMKDDMSGMWTMTSSEDIGITTEDVSDLSNAFEIEGFEKIMKDLKITGDDGDYKIEGSVGVKEFIDLLKDSEELAGVLEESDIDMEDLEDEEVQEELDKIEGIDIDIEIADGKLSLIEFDAKDFVTSLMKIDGGEKADDAECKSCVISISVTDMNEVEEFEVPEEVIEAANSFDLPIDGMEDIDIDMEDLEGLDIDISDLEY